MFANSKVRVQMSLRIGQAPIAAVEKGSDEAKYKINGYSVWIVWYPLKMKSNGKIIKSEYFLSGA